jgi:hypothetical protein
VHRRPERARDTQRARPARFGRAEVQTPTAEAATSRVYGITFSAIMKDLNGDPAAVNSVNCCSV